MKLLQMIEDAASKIAPGRSPYFTTPHVVKALTTISAEGPIGRINLARTLGLGEGSIRTLVKHLEKEKLLETSRGGIVLTTKGHMLASTLKTKMSLAVEVPRSGLTVSSFNMAILIKNAAKGLKAGLEQRDAAIKVGAQGATTLIFKQGRLAMPLVEEDVLKHAPQVRQALISQLKPHENDVVVVGSADDRLQAEYGATAAALETLKAMNEQGEEATGNGNPQLSDL